MLAIIMYTAIKIYNLLYFLSINSRAPNGSKGKESIAMQETQGTWVWVDSGVSDGQGGLVCCGSCGRKESDMTERLN